MKAATASLVVFWLTLPVGAPACAQETFTPVERFQIQSLSLAALPPLAPDPTNEAIGDPTAMALGATLFFDRRMSRNGEVACSTCHQIGSHFQDGLALGHGIGTMNRRTQPLAGVAWQRWFFWDGRKDSLWSQALGPLEKPQEHGLTRAWVAHFIAENFRDRYERIFGPMPDLSTVPPDAGPFTSEAYRQAWRDMKEADRHAVNRVFVNVGKMIAAFETSLTFSESRFDRFARALEEDSAPEGDANFSDQEIAGLKLFLGRGNCDSCHSGPRFTDDGFHNTGVPPVAGLPADRGRRDGLIQLFEDEFNCRGGFNAAPAGYCPPQEAFDMSLRQINRAFKTPSLRGSGLRPPYMHAGQFASLERVVDHYNQAPPAGVGRTEIAPLNLTAEERQALIAFLRTLD